MDKDKNLEQFFKNRVNDFDSTGDDWDMPDASVFRNAQQHFPKHPKRKERKLGMMLWIAMGVLLLSLLGYVFYLKKNIKTFETELQIAKVDLEKNNTTADEIKNLKEAFSKEISELKKENQNTSHTIETLTQENENLKIKNTLSHTLNENKQLIVARSSPPLEGAGGWSLDNRNLLLEKTTPQPPPKGEMNVLSNNVYSSGEKNKTIQLQKENAVSLLPSHSFQLLQKSKNTFDIQLPVHHDLIPPKNRKGKFEIGLYYSSLNLSIPLTYDFEKLEEDDFKKKDFSFPIQSKGARFHLAYAVRPNLWLTTGFRRTTGGFDKSFSTKLIYDKSGEYTDADGKTLNEVDIKTQSGFGDAGNNIDFEIPNGTDIEDGDFVEANWDYSQQFQFTQIPVGVNYFFGKNKLQGFLNGGLGWNRVSIGEYFVEADLKYNNEILPINKNEQSKTLKVNSQFINGFAGVGLNYQLTRNWNARTSFTLEKNFIQSEKYLDSNDWSKGFDIGLNYRF